MAGVGCRTSARPGDSAVVDAPPLMVLDTFEKYRARDRLGFLVDDEALFQEQEQYQLVRPQRIMRRALSMRERSPPSPGLVRTWLTVESAGALGVPGR